MPACLALGCSASERKALLTACRQLCLERSASSAQMLPVNVNLLNF